MRKLAVFLALVAVGAALLVWFERSTRVPAVAPRDELPERSEDAPGQHGVLTPVGGADQDIQITVSGPTDAFTYEKAPDGKLLKRTHLVARDLVTTGGGNVELRDFQFELFDPPTAMREVAARAALAKARVKEDAKAALALDETTPVELETATIDYEVGSRFAPLELKLPTLAASLAFERATSPDQVAITGRGLQASGRGLLLERLSESVTLERDPRAQVVLDDASVVDLACRAAMVMRARPDLGVDHAEFTLTESAKLVLRGERGLSIDADAIALVGRIERGADERFQPIRAEAEGRVTLTDREGTARGERLLVEFDELGRLASGALDGRPELELVLRGTRLQNVPGDLLREGETLTVLLDGAGPVEFSYGERPRFAFAGPVRMRMPSIEALLECDGEISGTRAADGRVEEFVADSNVRLNYGELRLATARAIMRSTLTADGRALAVLDSAGPTTITGRLPDRRPVDVIASGGLTLERAREHLVIRNAGGVALSLGGERPLRASARSVRDLDLLANALLAVGDVQFENELGRGRGAFFQARSLDEGELRGSDDEPATFEFDGGTFRAQFIEASRARLVARGRAHAELDYEDSRIALDSDWVTIQRVQRADGARAIVLDAGERASIGQTAPGWKLDLTADFFHVEALEEASDPGRPRFTPELARATGAVEFTLSDPTPRLVGKGALLTLRGDRSGTLEPSADPEARVELRGKLERRIDSFELRARRVEFQPDMLVAVDYDGDFYGLALELDQRGDTAPSGALRAVGGYAVIERAQIALTEGVYLGGQRTAHESWSLDALSALLRSQPDARGDASAQSIQDLIAEGSVRIRTGTLGRATAHALTAAYGTGKLALIGRGDAEPDREAVVERAGSVWRSTRFEVDLVHGFLRSERGSVRSAQTGLEAWTLDFDGIETLALPDETIQVLRQPRWSNGSIELRSNWALAWIDPNEWRRLEPPADQRNELRLPDPSVRPAAVIPRRLFGRFALDQGDRWLREIYLEGNVEYRIGSLRKATADGVYLDLVDGRGWVDALVLAMDLPIGSRTYALKLRASWVRASPDGSLVARDAVATTCEFEEPDYMMRIGEFSIRPRYEESEDTRETAARRLIGWQLTLSNNQLALVGAFGLPLPRLGGPMSLDYEFDREALSLAGVRLPSFGSDSKVGAFISTSFTSDIGAVGRGVHWAIGKLAARTDETVEIDGRTRTRVDLHSRGVKVGVESSATAKGLYDWTLSADGVLDTRKDRGLVRVDEDDRELVRAWLHGDARVLLGDDQWLDARVSRQTDAGVQAEFYESEFVAFDEHETYLHWRLADDADYWSATVGARLETFRHQVIEQPSLGWYRGRNELGSIGSLPVVHSFATSVAHLRRFEGDDRYHDPFDDPLAINPLDPPFPDNTGDRDIVRADARTSVEMPWSTGVAGVRITPYLSARATGWSENLADDGDASQAALLGGVQASTTLWRAFDGGSRHMLTPTLRVRGDAAFTEDGGAVLQQDELDRTSDGGFVDLALRSRWEHPERSSDLDLELASTYAEDPSPTSNDGWQPLSARVEWLSEFLGVPYGLWHQGRYDTDAGETDYSRSIAGVELLHDFEVELGYHTARDASIGPANPKFGQRLYEAMSMGGRYALSTKWEVEGQQTISARDDGSRLSSSLTLRRFGHDFVFEIDYTFVAGEGAHSLSFHFTPLFSWRRGDASLLDRWRRTRN